jgi:predicted N-acetyltransferase YhbS
MPANAKAVDAEPAMEIARETDSDAAAIDSIVSAAFGPGRFTKISERLREGNQRLFDLCFVARLDGELVGTVRLWPVLVDDTAVAFLGPLAVDLGARSAGVGAALIGRACVAAEAAGWPAVLLVGDAPYFERFGFERASVELPGPVDPRRVLIRLFGPGAAPSGVARVPRYPERFAGGTLDPIPADAAGDLGRTV